MTGGPSEAPWLQSGIGARIEACRVYVKLRAFGLGFTRKA